MTDEVKSLSEVMPERKELYPDVDRIESSELMGNEFILKEVNELDGKHGKFYVALVEFKEKEMSTAFGSKVVNERISQVADKLPLKCRLIEKKSKEGRLYYDLE